MDTKLASNRCWHTWVVFTLTVLLVGCNDLFDTDDATASESSNNNEGEQEQSAGTSPFIDDYTASDSGFVDGDLNADAVSYLSSGSDDTVTGTVINSDGRVVVAGNFTGRVDAIETIRFLNASDSSPGQLLIIDAHSPATIERAVRLGSRIDQVVMDPSTGELVAIGDFGLIGLTPAADKERFHIAPGALPALDRTPQYGSGYRLAMGQNGHFAVMGNDNGDAKVAIYNANGELQTSYTLPRGDIGGGTYNESWEDIAFDNTNQRLFVTGFAQRCSDYQSAFVLSYDLSGDQAERDWLSFNLWCSAAQELNLGADSRGKRVQHQDDALLFVGHTDGGNNRFTRRAPDQMQGESEPNLVVIDRWNNGAGFGSGRIGFFAELNPNNGETRVSQFQYTSADANAARSFEIRAVTRTESGEVLIGGGNAQDALPERANLSLSGQNAGNQVSNETGLIAVTPDFEQRTLIATLTGNNGDRGMVEALASRNGRHVAVGTTQGTINTLNIFNGSGTTGAGTWIMIWSAP